ncbi:MAG: hypothetical protein Q8O36_04665 [Candidatus Omnitrophota bacterium]|nr:hypothetical protein [Candidatus Omnitrophota bacterium]
MKITKTLLLVCLLFVLPILVYSSEKDWQGININQPISIGEVIYRNTVNELIGNKKVMSCIAYIYDGCDVNSIKIKIDRIAMSSEAGFVDERPAENKTIPLNAKKQSLLKVETLDNLKPSKEILITVIDEFYRIKVEEYRK